MIKWKLNWGIVLIFFVTLNFIWYSSRPSSSETVKIVYVYNTTNPNSNFPVEVTNNEIENEQQLKEDEPIRDPKPRM